MNKIVSNKRKQNTPVYPRVKIYYLKNDKPIDQEPKVKVKQLNAPTLSFLSSFIQRQNQFDSIQQNQFIIGEVPAQGQTRSNQNKKNNYLSNCNQEEELQQQQHKQKSPNFNRKAFTVQTRKLTQLKQMQQGSYNPNQKIYKRLIKTSHQKYLDLQQNNPQKIEHNKNNSYNKQPTQQKDYLCNLVREWSHYKGSQRIKINKKNRKSTIQSLRKNYSEQQANQMKQNKNLMKEHFNLFLQNQNKKKNKTKQPSLSHLKAVFQRQQQKNGQENQQLTLRQKKFKQLFLKAPNSSRRTTSLKNVSKSPQKGDSLSRRNKNKDNYFRLLQGPQLRLIPHLFQSKYHIENFNWTKVNDKAYETQSRRDSVQQN